MNVYPITFILLLKKFLFFSFVGGREGGGNWGMLGCFHCFACLETIFIWLCIGAVDDVPFHLP